MNHSATTSSTSVDTSTRSIVKFFTQTDDLYETLEEYLRGGIAEGAGVLLVMNKQRWMEFSLYLEARQFALARTFSSEQMHLVLIPSASSDGDGKNQWFQSAVTASLQQLLDRWPTVRVYGEYIDTLAHRGQFEAIDHFERLWGRWIERHRFALMCGYRLPSADSTGESRAVADALGGSQRVLPPGTTTSAAAVDWQRRMLEAIHRPES